MKHPRLPISFDQDDPFFAVNGTFNQTKFNHQTNLHQELLREAGRFIGDPYGWGGQTFGGKQSLTSGFYTNSDTNAIPGEVPVLGSSIYNINGYGIDCSGFITEVAQRIGIPQPSGYPSGMDTGALLNDIQHTESVAPKYLRPGDFIVWRTRKFGSDGKWHYGGHVVYVKEKPVSLSVTSAQTIEAFPDSGGINGKVTSRTRLSRDWTTAPYVYAHDFKRWK